jgi:pimeloyl-ACP methyl ester carboxylesterase
MNTPTLNYQVIGSGLPLLMIHGFGISFNIWQKLIPLLCPHFSLVIIELPGVGNSSMPDMEEAYLDQAVAGIENIRKLLNIEHWQVFGYSYGVFVAKRYLQMYPISLSGVIFLCPAHISNLNAFVLQSAFQVDKIFPQFGNWVLSGASLKFLIDLLGFNLQKNELSAKWFAEISSQPVEVLKKSLQSIVEQKEMKIPVDLPVCFIWGDKDLLAKPPYKFLSAQEHVIHSTHSAPQTAAGQIAELAIPFLLSNSKSSK